MNAHLVHLLAIRIFISFLGVIGNVLLILSIIQTKFSRIKSFEMFLLELATANLEEIIIVNIYDMMILQSSSTSSNNGWCQVLKVLTVFGEVSSILFTVLISIFRYQKLRDADKRVNVPIYLDSIKSVWVVSGACVMLAILLSIPIFAIDIPDLGDNVTGSSAGCPPDFFHCHKDDCPLSNGIYKYTFIVLCNLLPLIIVTVTSCLIITVLLSQRRVVKPVVKPVVSVSGSGRFNGRQKGPRFQRSTIAVLAAMGLFQVDWTIYLIFQLTISPSDFPLWGEMEFLISTSYTSLSPYVYGIGNNLFSLKSLIQK